jgi:tRNA(Met) cytidine acetyltransferase
MFSKYTLNRKVEFITDHQQAAVSMQNCVNTGDELLLVSDSVDDFMSPTMDKINTCLPSQINRHLGQEIDHLFYDCHDFNPNSFAAAIGCLCGGGKLYLLMFKENQRLAKSALDQQPNKPVQTKISVTLSRLIERLNATNLVKSAQHSYSDVDVTAEEHNDFLSHQRTVIDAIKRCAKGHAKRPVVITANRGRGKSAALGIATAELINEFNKKVIITASNRSQTTIYQSHLRKNLATNNETGANSSKETPELTSNFVALDALLAAPRKADLLIVEEAGAIPVQQLLQLIDSYNRVVFSTTTDGYEGNGQGFLLRFLPVLSKRFKQWKHFELDIPFRWPINDPIESAVFDAFCLRNSNLTLPDDSVANYTLNIGPNADLSLEKLKFKKIEQQQLRINDALLKQVYQLLVTAHYQTRPTDLERLLSDSSFSVFAALDGNSVIGVIVLTQEGDLSSELCEIIETTGKRKNGHLLPQSLMAFQGLSNAGTCKFWRIMRVAVHPNYRRNGIASRLVQLVEEFASEQFVTHVGTSFSLAEDVVQFWYQLGYQCNRIALRKDSSSGSYPAEFIKSLRPQTDAEYRLIANSLENFANGFSYRLNSSFKSIDTHILLHMLEKQIRQYPGIAMPLVNAESAWIYKEVTRFTEGARGFEMVDWLIYSFVWSQILKNKTWTSLDTTRKCLLIDKVMRSFSWQELVTNYKLSGKKAAQLEIKESLLILLK